MAVTFDVDPWIAPEDVQGNCQAEASFLPMAAQVASNLLYELVGRQFSAPRSEIVRPSPERCRCACHPTTLREASFDDFWRGWVAGSCSVVSSVTLSEDVPVTSVTSVKVDGVLLTAGVDYRLDNDRDLVRLADPVSGAWRGWPCCGGRVDLPASAVGTFAVEFVVGGLSALAIEAAKELACQIALAMSSKTKNLAVLPVRQLSLTGRGLVGNSAQAARVLKQQAPIGLYFVDLFISTHNPRGLARPPIVRSPDFGPAVYRPGT